MTLTISTRSLGRRKPLLDDFAVPPPPTDGAESDDYRLRHLIEHVVRRQIDAFRKRQNDMCFDRVLTARQIDAGAARGKVDPAAKGRAQTIDEEDAVATAMIAFEDGLYLVLVDGVEHHDLDERVALRPDSRLVFLRLAFLAGA